MIMETFNWITVKNRRGETIRVRQSEKFGNLWLGDDGVTYVQSELDFTQIFYAFPYYDKCNKEWDEHFKANQEMMGKMLSSIDVNAVADHKAKIDEREYWRKLRGDICLAVMNNEWADTVDDALEFTDDLVCGLYSQDRAFFKDASDEKA